MHDATNTVPSGIVFRNDNNTGVVNSNSLLYLDDTLNTYVSERGIVIASGTSGNMIVIGTNDNNFVLPYNGVNATNSYYLVLSNNAKLFAGTGSPEGVVTAETGSVFIRTNGTPGATLYLSLIHI